MSKTLIIGANGQIGRKVISQMSNKGLPVLAMVRNQQQCEALQQLGAETILGDLEQTLPDEAFSQCDKLVFTAGSGGHTGADKTILVDLWGACKAIDKAAQHHIKQFVMVSSRDAGDPDAGSSPIKHYNICKHFADEYLIQSGVPYTILRPGRLTNDSSSNGVTIERPVNKEQQIISRADVATCIVQCLTHSDTIGKIYELYQGDMNISEALSM